MSVMSASTSNAEAFAVREVGRPFGLPLRPFGNQPGFERERDLLASYAVQDAASRPAELAAR